MVLEPLGVREWQLAIVSSCPGEREKDIVRGITVSSFLETSTRSPLKSPAWCARQDFFS